MPRALRLACDIIGNIRMTARERPQRGGGFLQLSLREIELRVNKNNASINPFSYNQLLITNNKDG